MKKSFIRAVMKSGKALTFESSWEGEVIFIFHNFYHSAKARIYPKSSYSLPDSWKNEIFPQFVDPEGIIVRFDLIAGRPLPYTINSMWFEMDSEGRNHLKSERPVELVYQFTGIKHSTRFPGEYEVIAVDKSHPSFHMGVNGLKQLESLKWKLELQNINHVESDMNNELTEKSARPEIMVRTMKERILGDNSGMFNFVVGHEEPELVVPKYRGGAIPYLGDEDNKTILWAKEKGSHEITTYPIEASIHVVGDRGRGAIHNHNLQHQIKSINKSKKADSDNLSFEIASTYDADI